MGGEADRMLGRAAVARGWVAEDAVAAAVAAQAARSAGPLLQERPRHVGRVGVLTAGTSDVPVAEEAATIAEAIRHPGFSLIQVLSPCITYHPEQQKGWKDLFHPGFEATSWQALLAPARTPDAVVRRVAMETIRIVRGEAAEFGPGHPDLDQEGFDFVYQHHVSPLRLV